MSIIYLLLILLNTIQYVKLQSTCPVVVTQSQQRCKCGIKIDGHIYIYCARKQLNQLPKFTRSSILYDELILSGNSIRKITANSFNGLRVKRLFLDDNPLEHIETNSFNELANYLEELIISVNYDSEIIASIGVSSYSSNKKPQLPPTLFQNLLNLKMIKLVGLEWNMMGVLKQNTFNRTRKLEIVNLIDCGIQRIEESSLSGLESSLKELNMDNNQLIHADDIFREIRKMKRIQILNLSRNRIRSIGRFMSNQDVSSVSTLNDLQLDLSFNAITQIDEFGFGISSFDIQSGLANSITKLNLNNNELTEHNLNFIGQLLNLKELNLDYNKIQHLPDNLFTNMPKLEILTLKGNYLTSLNSEFVFSGLHFNLRKLNLASNRLNTLSRRVFMSTPKLKELHLEKNQLGSYFDHIQQVSEKNNDLMNAFEGVESELKLINLEHNHLKPDHLFSLANLLNLETIKLGHNDLSTLNLKANQNTTSIVKLFEFYRNLTNLDMQNTSLKQMPYFKGLNRTLLNLNLAQNSLCNINSNNLKHFYSKLKYLNLNSNPLNCDCNLLGLRKYMDEMTQNIDTNLNDTIQLTLAANIQNNWKCSQPTQFSNKNLNKLNMNDFQCNSNELSAEDYFQESSVCQLDDDFNSPIIKPTTKKSTTTTTVRILNINNDLKILDAILINEFSTKKPNISSQITTSTTKQTTTVSLNIDGLLISSKDQIIQHHPTSLFTSLELKQTLLGSFIGALSVIMIVVVSICIVKTTTRTKFLCGSKKANLSLSSDEKDKSNTTNTTSPYGLGKLSLQTFCINSTSSSVASSSSSGTNSSCVCNNHVNTGNNQDTNNIFTKMDPMRLTLMSSNSNTNNNNNNYLNFSPNLIYQHYLNSMNNNSNNNNSNNQANNLHYLASNITSGSGTPPSSSPYELTNSDSNTIDNNKILLENNEKILSLLNNSKIYITQLNTSPNNTNVTNSSIISETNTYDKLHQQRVCTFRPGATSSSSQLNFLNAKQFGTLATSFNQHTLKAVNNNLLTNAAETTPFLIITDVNGLLLNQNNNANNMMTASTASDDLSNQHTYHEIGDVLLGYNNNINNQRFSSQHVVGGNPNKNNQIGSDKTNGMYI